MDNLRLSRAVGWQPLSSLTISPQLWYLSAKRAAYEVLKSSGGLDGVQNASEIPSRPQAKYQASKHKGVKDDPLQDLSKKFHREGDNGVIRRIQINDKDIVLFKNSSIENIANFCCAETPAFKSALCFDFTFDLAENGSENNPPFYALATSYRNTTLLTRCTENCPVLLGPLIICHREDEHSEL